MSVPHPLMLPDEVAATFGVAPSTVVRWADIGRISFIRLPSADGAGARRYLRAEIDAQLAGTPLTREQVAEAWEQYRTGGGR